MGLAPTAPIAPARQKRQPTAQEVAFIAKDSARELLATDERVRSRGVRGEDFDVWGSLLAELDQEVSGAISGERIGDALHRFRAELESHHLEAPKDIDELRPMVYKWATAQGLALKQVVQRGQGEPVETPEPHPEPETLKAHKAPPAVSAHPAKKAADQLKLRDIFALWQDHELKRPAKTVARAELAVRRFEAVMGKPAVASLTRADGAEYRKKLMGDKKLTVGMASAQMVWINIFLNFEVNNHQRITVNPWAGLGITNTTTTSRDEWKDAQVVKLFDSPIFKAYELPTVDRAGLDAAYWVPLIGAYTGC